MANNVTTKIWTLDTLGVISLTPVRVKKIVLIPNAAADLATIATLKGAFVSNGISKGLPLKAGALTAKSTMQLKTVTVTSNSIITSTANDFETAEVAALDVIDIYHTSTGNNLGVHLVLTRNGDTNVTTSGVTLTNDVAATYSWAIYTPLTVTNLVCNVTEKAIYTLDFPEGFVYESFVLTALSTSAKLQVYLW